MNRIARTIAIGGAAIAISAGLGSQVASAATAPHVAPKAMGDYTVTPYRNTDVLDEHWFSGAVISHMAAGHHYQADCWAHGAAVTIPGTSDKNDIWVWAAGDRGLDRPGWVPAAYLQGGSTGGVGRQCW